MRSACARSVSGRLVVAVVSGNRRHVELAYAALRFDLAAHRRHRVGRRADEDDSRRGDRACERRTFREKTVTRVHRVGAHRDAGGDDRVDVEIGLRRRCRPDAARVVDEAQMVRVRVGFGVDSDRHDAGFARAARDAHRDLSAISDEQAPDHAWKLGLRRSRNARKPSCPSGLMRRSAIARVVIARDSS